MEKEIPRERQKRTDGDEFPEFEREFETVTDIEERMIEARENWEPPEKPTYDPNADTEPPLKSGIVRSITEKNANDGKQVRFGVDTGESDELKWFSVKDTGERALSNPYVKVCKTYGVNPTCPQDFYNKTVEYTTRYDSVVTRPHFLPVRILWSGWWIPHYRYDLWRFKKKRSGFRGRVPTKRFFGAYSLGLVGLVGATRTVGSLVGGNPIGFPVILMFSLMLILSSIIFVWGCISKVNNDVLPYLAERLDHAAEMYSHQNA